MKLIAAIATVLVLCSAAHAEDYDWSGVYVGIGVAGVGLNNGTTGTITDNTGLAATDPAAIALDPQLDLSAGYNLLLKKKLLLGIEADLQFMLPQDGASQ